MKRNPAAGFTLIELLVVIGILSVLMVALLPAVLEGQREADVFADKANLKWHYDQHTIYRNRKHKLPPDGGHKFVLAPWVMGVCDHTEENRDRFFTPGIAQDDPRWGELSELDPREIWQSFDELSQDDTHYAGRASEHYKTMRRSGNEAIMANVLPNGTVNVLMSSGSIRTLEPQDELKDFVDPDDPDYTVDVGPDSPVELLQKLIW